MKLTDISDRYTRPRQIVTDDGSIPTRTPFVSYGYGNTRPAEPGLIQSLSDVFSLYTYCIVHEDDVAGENILLISDRMQSLMEAFAIEMNGFTIQTSDAVVEGVRLAEARTGGGKFTRFELLEFRFDFKISTKLAF